MSFADEQAAILNAIGRVSQEPPYPLGRMKNKFLEDFYEIAALIEYGTSFFSKRIVFALYYHFSRHVASRNRGNYGMRGIRESCLGTKEQDQPKVVRIRT